MGEGWRITGGKLPARKTFGPYSSLRKVADVLINNKETIFGKDPDSPSVENVPKDYDEVYSALQKEREIQNIKMDWMSSGRAAGMLFEWNGKQFHLTALGTSKIILKNITERGKAQMFSIVDFISDPVSVLRDL